MHDLNTIRRLNGEATAPEYRSATTEAALDRTAMAVLDYLSSGSRLRTVAGTRHLEIFKNGEWVRVFSPDVPPAPKGFSTVRSA